MRDALARQAVEQGGHPAIRAILQDVCRITKMGFAAIARVTEDRWIVCQVLDRIEFGLDPGDELSIKTTICDDIRRSGRAVFVDNVSANIDWRTHHAPMLYGFESYASLPLYLDDGAFFGTLCAIDPAPHELTAAGIVAALEDCARRATAILSRLQAPAPDGSRAADEA